MSGSGEGEMTGSREQRRDDRHPLLLRVDHPDGTPAHDVTENLSAGGLFLRTDRPLEVGARTPLLLGFPGLLEPLEVEVEVVWTRAAGAEHPAGAALRIPDDRPEHRRRVARIAAAAAAPAHADARSFRLLVVEDNALVEAMYEHALRLLAAPGGRVELAVEYARDGAEALARLAAEPGIDLIVTDLYMPNVDGFELVRRVRADPRHHETPIVSISGGGDDARDRALEAGVDVYLRKPVRVQDVLGTVRTLLRIR
jgi:uncharacterized protein (TIGR02266 family)